MSIPAFALATLTPAALILAGALAGGPMAFATLLYMTAFALILDQVLPSLTVDQSDAEFPAGDALLAAVALTHLAVLPLVTWAIAGDSGLTGAGRAALFLGTGLWIGQVVNPAAHELIHRGNRWLYRLGGLLFTSILFGQHTSAHRLVHHIHAASPDDPNTARRGESFYRFFFRAWGGAFTKGWQTEAARGRLNPYLWYLSGAGAALAVAFVVAGWAGVAVWAGLALHAQIQLMLSDYVQHYGLTRKPREGGRLEPVTDRHSWNAPHWFSATLMLNAPRHSDHHAHPGRPYPALRLPGPAEAPMLPVPLPLACTVALIPPLWRRMIHPHLAQWR
jgi:alkane 1-monooxygenase